jgi:hypothetical protein
MEERRKLLNVRVRISYIYPDLRRGRRRRKRRRVGEESKKR